MYTLICKQYIFKIYMHCFFFTCLHNLIILFFSNVFETIHYDILFIGTLHLIVSHFLKFTFDG